MRPLSQFARIYLHRASVDFRKSINGLGAIVQEEMLLDPFESALFLFCCRRRKSIKALYWDRTGFALWFKKLERDLFPWPRNMGGETLEITPQELEWVLGGIDIWKIVPHQEKKYQKMC